MTDARLFQTHDGGDLEFANDDLVTTDIHIDSGLETAAYLSMFGGNERDSGLPGDRLQWWGNIGEPLERQQRSETQHLLRDLPAVSSNLLRLEDAASRDLQWFRDSGLASAIEVTAYLSSVDTVTFQIRIVIQDQNFSFAFEGSWGA